MNLLMIGSVSITIPIQYFLHISIGLLIFFDNDILEVPLLLHLLISKMFPTSYNVNKMNTYAKRSAMNIYNVGMNVSVICIYTVKLSVIKLDML